MEKQYQLNDNVVILRVKKAPLFIRAVMFLFSFLCFLLPLAGMILGISMGKGMHMGYVLGLFVFGFLGFYMLRIALWSTYGKETIVINNKSLTYLADYGWFKDGKKEREISESIEFLIRSVGYEEENKGALVIALDEPIMCVTKMPNTELEELIDKLNDKVGKA